MGWQRNVAMTDVDQAEEHVQAKAHERRGLSDLLEVFTGVSISEEGGGGGSGSSHGHGGSHDSGNSCKNLTGDSVQTIYITETQSVAAAATAAAEVYV